jgi:hypothetical protein
LRRLVEHAGLVAERIQPQGHRLGSVLGLVSQWTREEHPLGVARRLRDVFWRFLTVLLKLDREAAGRTYTTGYLVLARKSQSSA